MSKNNVIGPEGRETIGDPVTELLRVGAQKLIQRAVEAAGRDAAHDVQTGAVRSEELATITGIR